MKRITIITVLLIALTLFGLVIGCVAQTKVIKQGNDYIAVKDSITHKRFVDTATSYTYTDTKGHKYPLFVSKTGKYYVWVLSKNNNMYKKYIKLD